MKTITLISVAFAAFLIAGCAPPAANTNTANAGNANAAKTTAAPPTVDALIAMDKAAQEAFNKGDAKWFQDNLSSKFVMYPNGKRYGKEGVTKMIGTNKCDVKSLSFTEPVMTKINDDTYVVSFKSTMDGTCTMDGKTEKLPAETRTATLWTREGDKWMAAWHGENTIIDPKNPPPAPAKKEEPKAGNSSTTNSNANANSANTASPAPAAPSANTAALVKIHQAGWEAFKAKDAKWFNDNIASSFSFIDPIGTFVGSKAEAIKRWTETMKCEGITNVKVSDGFATALSPTVEILTLTGNADGACDGQKNGDLYQTAVYVKEGDAWKLAFMSESAGD